METNQETEKKVTSEEVKAKLLESLSPFKNEKDLWNFTYMIHSKKHINVSEPKDDKVECLFNNFCVNDFKVSRLEKFCKSKTESVSNKLWLPKVFNFNTKQVSVSLVTRLCSSFCTDSIAFCPYKMAFYIERICKTNEISIDDIYKNFVDINSDRQSDYNSIKDCDIKADEYDFIDPISAVAAYELIDMDLIATDNIGNRVTYSYVPICENTKKSFLSDVIDFHKTRNGSYDFINADMIRSELNKKRKCTDCIFPQCPDKVAAYISFIAKKYNVSPSQLALFIADKNKIKGMSLKGNYIYYENLRKLNNIPFSKESKTLIDSIFKFAINKFTSPNKKIPFMNFNLAIHTADEKLADETAMVFKNTLWYFGYFGKTGVDYKIYKYSETDINAIAESIRKIEKPTIVYIKELDLMSSGDSREMSKQQLAMANLCNVIRRKEDKVLVVISGEKENLQSSLAMYNDFYNGLISYHLDINDISTDRIVKLIMEKLSDTYTFEDGFEPELEYYVISEYAESTLKSKAFVNQTVEKIIFNHFNKEINVENTLQLDDIPSTDSRRTEAEIWGELNSLAGLENVKSSIKELEDMLMFNKKMSSKFSKSFERPNMHMVFTGNPGTGKTTVARLIAEILYNIGFIKQNKLVEVSSKDLIGQYIGHTAPLTAKVCRSAYDGVLFIDEAYNLAVNGGTYSDKFRAECIAELIQQMENNRDRLIVIFAGYTKEMEEFLDSNPGLRSRIGNTLEFADYSTEQLLDIFCNIVYSHGLKLSDRAKTLVVENIDNAKNSSDFGNARYVRNLYEKTLIQHAKNTVDSNDEDELLEIRACDIV